MQRWPPACSGLRPSSWSVPWPWTRPTRPSLAGAGAVLLGAREHTTIPSYLKNADVLVVPHVVTEFTDSLDPIKVYEYLAAGRPVVSTPVSGFRELEDTVVTVVPGASFTNAVLTAIVTPPPPAATPIRVATWDVRARTMASILDQVGAG